MFALRSPDPAKTGPKRVRSRLTTGRLGLFHSPVALFGIIKLLLY
jgi:hypothetical protein